MSCLVFLESGKPWKEQRLLSNGNIYFWPSILKSSLRTPPPSCIKVREKYWNILNWDWQSWSQIANNCQILFHREADNFPHLFIIDREAREIMYLVASVRPSVRVCVCLSFRPLLPKKSHYQSKVFVCVSVICWRVRIIARRRSIGF